VPFRYRVYLEDGTDLDDYTSSEPNWKAGDELYVDGFPAYRIRAVIPMNDPDNEEYQGIWEVEPV
jgi:hypothetical protein